MAIPESQLDTWSKQGSVTQSKTTYSTVRTCLESKDAPYSARSKLIFLQGSYGNDTNIYSDSDVDIVITTDSIFYYDTSDLKPNELAAFTAHLTSGSGYSYDKFEQEVIDQLINKFGSSVKPRKKAIFIGGDGNRRDTDVLPAIEHRRYTRFNTATDCTYAEGISFRTSDGVKIINYPKQHSANLTAKHQRTNNWLKPTVRVIKNMRNTMIDKGYIADGIAPSYFLEGMLYNVPDIEFGSSYAHTFANAINWITRSDRAKLLCANEQYLLLHATSPVTWRAENLQKYLDAVTKFWNDW